MSTIVQNIGRVVQVIGPVIDVEFEPDKMPSIYILQAGKNGNGWNKISEVEPANYFWIEIMYFKGLQNMRGGFSHRE